MCNSQQPHSKVFPRQGILIVEDDPTIGQILLEALQDETSCQVFLASSGEMALQKLQTVEPELFLLDYHLPGMNGLELTNQLRNRAGYDQRRVIMMSADLPPDGVARDHLRWLQKPFDLDMFLQLVTELLALQEQISPWLEKGRTDHSTKIVGERRI